MSPQDGSNNFEQKQAWPAAGNGSGDKRACNDSGGATQGAAGREGPASPEGGRSWPTYFVDSGVYK